MESIQTNNFFQSLATLQKFSWDFYVDNNPTSIACYSFSENDARLEILQFLTKIDSMCESHRNLNTYLTEEELETIHGDCDDYIGCYTTTFEHFYLKMEIYASSCGKTTLEEYIKSSASRVSNFKKILMFSCLDG